MIGAVQTYFQATNGVKYIKSTKFKYYFQYIT